MKKLISIIFLAGIFMSCATINQSWSIPKNAHAKKRITMTLLGVKVDRTGGWDSVERETAALAPLYFWNRGCRIVGAAEHPAYAAEIQMRERDFNLGFRSRKSLAVEVHIWTYEDAPVFGIPLHERKLPVAVGRVVTIGEKSFSSSEVTDQLLSKAISNAAKQLSKNEKQKNKERQKKDA